MPEWCKAYPIAGDRTLHAMVTYYSIVCDYLIIQDPRLGALFIACMRQQLNR